MNNFEKMGILRKFMFLMGMVFTLPSLISLLVSFNGDEFQFKMFIIGIIFSIVSIFLMYISYTSKDPLEKKSFDKLLLYKNVLSMLDCKEKYLDKLKNTNNYIIACELYNELPNLHNTYAHQVLSTQIELSKPISSESAGFIGTLFGGIAVGMASAMKAKVKEEQYKQNVKDIIESKVLIGNAYDKMFNCYNLLDEILCDNNSIKKNWNNAKEENLDDLKEKYFITSKSMWWY